MSSSFLLPREVAHLMTTSGSANARLELNARYLPALVAALFLAQLVAPFAGWMTLLAGLGLAWFLAYKWARSLEKGLELTREVRYGWAQVGDQLQERFTLANHGWAPAPWVEIADCSI